MTQKLLICIGAQKAGTTWLADYFREHPQVHSPPVKEVHFFDSRFVPEWCAKYEEDMLAEFQRQIAQLTIETCGDPAIQQRLHAMLLRFRMIANPNEYLRFMSWGAQSVPVLFEATPDYSMLGNDGFQMMREIHPDVRLIFLLRNPADRIWSSMTFNRTHNPKFDIEAMFDRLLEREDFMLLADYERTLQEAQSVFGEDRIHLEFYERLFDQAAVDKICRFAGIGMKSAEINTRSNASRGDGAGGRDEMPANKRARACAAYAHIYRAIASRFDNDIPENWIQDMAQYGL